MNTLLLLFLHVWCLKSVHVWRKTSQPVLNWRMTRFKSFNWPSSGSSLGKQFPLRDHPSTVSSNFTTSIPPASVPSYYKPCQVLSAKILLHFLLHVWSLVCEYMCCVFWACLHMCACACGGPKLLSNIFLLIYTLHLIYRSRAFHLKPELAQVASLPRESLVFAFWAKGWQENFICSDSPESGPQSCVVNSLPTEPSPKLLFCVLF